MAENVDFWGGMGKKMMVVVDMFDAGIVKELIEATALNISSPKAILGLGDGPCVPSLRLAQKFPDAKVTSTDIADGMMKAGEERVKELGVTNVEVTKLNMDQDMANLSDASYDIVASTMGIMFSKDQPELFKQIHRVLKPGGVFAAAVWQENSMAHVCEELGQIANGPDFRFTAVIPVSENCKDADAVDKMLQDVGFSFGKGHNGMFTNPMNFGKFGSMEALDACVFPLAMSPFAKEPNKEEKLQEMFEHFKTMTKHDKNGDFFLDAPYRIIIAKKAE